MDMALSDQLIYGAIASVLALLVGIFPTRTSMRLLAHLVVGLAISAPVATVCGTPALFALWGVLIIVNVSVYLLNRNWEVHQHQL